MPIPAAPAAGATPASVAVALFHQLHDELRSLIYSCDQATLNFVPCDGANSISTIVTHVVGSEAESVMTAAGIDCNRHRDDEFRRGVQSAAALLGQLDAADLLLDEVAPAFTDERLTHSLPLPTLPSNETRPALTWLIGNLGHAREHVGHAFLTKQLHDA
ncbi:MAG: DinB family protein, partial [Acidimicrobiia bacterium]